ncbi:MAG: hypothetical protein GW848_09935 [Rhodoferax sp.]|nr:hypothetical protein [Rhodoferax sp.]NCP55333.1 hypothetical protein [Rhodoferax sp.]
MDSRIDKALGKLSVVEKRVLGQALIGSAETQAFATLITDAQRQELRDRLAFHRAYPHEPTLTLAQIKSKLLSRVH